MAKLPHNRTWYTKKLLAKVKLCIKNRDKYICQKCLKEVSGSNAHASHVLNVGTHKALELDPSNLKCLCSYCHLHWWHKDVLHATQWFQEKFPTRYYYLMESAKLKWKIPTVLLAELHDNTKADGSDYGIKYYEMIKEVTNVANK